MVDEGGKAAEGAMMNIKSKERILSILIFFALVGLLFVVGYPIYTESQPSEVRFGVDKSYYSVPFYVALMDTTRNYFALEKVKAEFIEVTGDPLEGIKNGEYDVAVVPWYWLMISPSLNGDTVKAIGSLEMKSGRSLDAFIVPPNSKITKLRDLSGKRLGFLAHDEYLVNLVMAAMIEDLNLKRVEYVPLGVDEIRSAFEENKADVLYLFDPYRAYMIYAGNAVVAEGMASTYIVPNIPYGAIVMRKNFVTAEKRLAAIRAKNAVEAALGYLTRNPEVAKHYVLEINDMPDESGITTIMRTPEFERLPEVSVKSIEGMQTELVKRGIGTCGIKPSEFLFDRISFAR